MDMPVLPCPDCRQAGRGIIRIGTRRNICHTCNRHAGSVRRRVRNALIDLTPADVVRRIRLEVEADVYRQTIATYDREHPDDDAP